MALRRIELRRSVRLRRYVVRATNGYERGRYLTRRRAERAAERMNRMSRYHRVALGWRVERA